MRVPISSLVVTGSPRTSGEDPEHTRMLADTPAELPPIIVHRGTMRVLDGLHRLRAAERRNQTDILVRFFDGDETDAFVLAVEANVAHGLPLSTADRKAAATRIITWYPQWSDRRIASVTGLSAKTIAELRRCPPGSITQSSARVGQDGRLRPVDSRQRRERASKLILDNPELSLREVARTVGISPETARAVRDRLRCGEDPIVPRQREGASASERTDVESPRTESPTPADLATVVHHLRLDPTLRFSETGRTLLRLLNVHAMSDETWTAIVENVPTHCRNRIANAAMECAQSWRRFAERLERDDPAPP